MNFAKKSDAIDIKDVVYENVGMPMEEFLKDVRKPYIKNIPEAVRFVRQYMKENPDKPVRCVGDYDTDGQLATAIIVWGFKKEGKDIEARIPHRMSEGYGLSEKIIDEIDDGLVITVDNGITAASAIKKAKDKGLSVIVTDHHLPPRDEDGNMVLPMADIIVNPHIEEESEFKDYCGAAIALAFVQEMFPEANLYPLVVLAAIATVADVMPLIGANRTLVKDGLVAINKSQNVPGLNALILEKQMSMITEGDFGFIFGPIFNAPGRLYDNGSKIVLDTLCSKASNPELYWLAKELVDTNEKRKAIVKESLEVAETIVTDEKPIVIYHPSFMEGIIGILAGHLAEKYNTPCIVFTDASNGNFKGSARSIEGVHLKDTLDKIKDTMVGYGGHAGAAGLSVSPDKFEEFRQAFAKAIGKSKKKDDKKYYDLDITENDIPDMINEQKKYAPYGEGNPRPIFHLKLNLPASYQVMGDGSHFSMNCEDYKVVGFGMTKMYEEMGKPQKIDAICYLYEDFFKGKKTNKVELIDFYPAN